MRRNYQQLKTLADYRTLDAPVRINIASPPLPLASLQMILRMPVRPKYGEWKIPDDIAWLRTSLFDLAEYDASYTDIPTSWCYVTVRQWIAQ